MVDELRHLDKVRGNFLISESESISSLEISPQHPITDGYYTDSDKLVKMMKFVFETLWDNSIPAAEKINELETGSYYSQRESSSTIAKEEKKKIIDRFYICSRCNSAFIYAEDIEEHRTTTGHEGTKEFPFFEK